MRSGFLENLIGRPGKIGPEEVRNDFLRLGQEKGFLETVFNSSKTALKKKPARPRSRAIPIRVT